MADQIKVELLDDGRVKVTAGEVSASNHTSADRLLETIETMAGGEVQRQKVPPAMRQRVKQEIRIAVDG